MKVTCIVVLGNKHSSRETVECRGDRTFEKLQFPTKGGQGMAQGSHNKLRTIYGPPVFITNLNIVVVVDWKHPIKDTESETSFTKIPKNIN